MAVPIQSVVHVNVNCAQLPRSLAFYQAATGLAPESHTHPVPQDGAGFGLEGEVQWDAHILHDDRGFAGPGLDLLEWKRPAPLGTPHARANALGFASVVLGVPDLQVARRSAEASGARLHASSEAGEGAAPFFVALDPDGTTIELVQRRELERSRLDGVKLNVSDLSRSLDWYQRVLGCAAPEPTGSLHGTGQPFGLPGEVAWLRRRLLPAARDDFAIELVEWQQPAPEGAAYAQANHLGIYRMAFLVEDIRACHDELRRQGAAGGPPVFLDMGPEIPVDGVWACFFPDPDGACLELIETPKLSG